MRGHPSPLLSILIPSMHSRGLTLDALVESIRNQEHSDEVEILVYADQRRVPPGEKRNRLVSIASGAFIVHIDDDDAVSPRYVPAIVDAIERSPFTDAILVRGRRSHTGGKDVLFDYRLGVLPGHVDRAGVVWHTPGHLCPIRAEIAKRVPFLPLWSGEDIPWVHAVSPQLARAERAGREGEVLYYYNFDPDKKLG